MSDTGPLVHLLRNVPVQRLMKALERDGFSRKRKTHTGSVIYGHPDGRLVVVPITTEAIPYLEEL